MKTVFVAMVPATSWLTRPGGLVEKAVNGAISSLVYVGTAGSSTNTAPTRAIPALATLYVTVAFALSGYDFPAQNRLLCSTVTDIPIEVTRFSQIAD